MNLFETIRSKIFGTTSAEASPAPHSPTPVTQTVDVAAILDDRASKSSEKLDWRRSIVDLMKLLDMDSSQSARKGLAKELHYDGDSGDTAKMNVWLHKQVMAKLAAHGGKLPPDLAA